MATFAAVFTFSAEATKTAALAATTATSLITVGKNRRFAITATGAFNLKIVDSTSATTTATVADFEFPGSAVFTLETGASCDSLSVFNPGGSSITYWVQLLAV